MPRCTRPRPGDPQRCGQGERSTRSDHGRHRPDGRRLRRVSTRCCPRAPPLAFGSGRAAPSTRPTVAMPTAGQQRRACAQSFEHAAAPHPARPPAEVATSPRPWPGLQARPAVKRQKFPRQIALHSRLFFFRLQRWEGLHLVGKRGASTGMGSTQYGDIKLGSKDGGALGTLKCRSEGLVWESQVCRSRLLARQWACARLACACSGAPTGVRLRAPTPFCRPPAVRVRI